ncbi:methyltransferase domain-containing protein [Virgibacillus dakarensis]|uniref:class I SAM-dependent methyltransferase n=1 Tax=Virgibacillus dakarensis TaxID=1917889 RepID=UPI000B449C9D|nr:class I SAM-dependent methyltransferase [Virgibacillus dakarensis]MBT2214637.1 class I SAM-dependent methyltransferase [Virgibacillus dakarensis]MTW87930.1 methyltransferase domain-containing protein [Virgibacillus dakarensis]
MSIDFHDDRNQESYTSRSADKGWAGAIISIIDKGSIQHAVDIGCGGGIYSKALIDMGVPFVTGIDFSESMLKGARQNSENYEGQITFKIGNAYKTGLPNEHFDMVLERALIHHLEDLHACFIEAYRVLHENGVVVIQDRTPSDCFLEGDKSHIRGYIFELFPNLKKLEQRRRYTGHEVKKQLEIAGFKDVQEIKLWETRKKYTSKTDLLKEIKSRKGRSILFELSDAELEELISHIDGKLSNDEVIEEKDRWSIWRANK